MIINVKDQNSKCLVKSIAASNSPNGKTYIIASGKQINYSKSPKIKKSKKSDAISCELYPLYFKFGISSSLLSKYKNQYFNR